MSFPTTFPEPAISVLVGAVSGKSPGAGPIALASYDLVGYGLFKTFGDVKYMMQFDPIVLAKLAEAVPYDQVTKIVARYTELKATGISTWLLILTLVKEFGPVAIQLIQKLRDILASN